MINWKQVTGFEWDAGNDRKGPDKHGASRFESEQVFFNEPLLVLEDVKHSQSEDRYHALGKTDEDRILDLNIYNTLFWDFDSCDFGSRYASQRKGDL